MAKIALALVLLSATLGPATAAERNLPADAGWVDVRAYGAKGDGIADDTAAIRAAIAATGTAPNAGFWKTRTVYFPQGTYRVSDTLAKRDANGQFDSGLILVGADRDRTVIRLADGAPGFQSASTPKSVVMTTARLMDGSPTSGGKDWIRLGEGNDAYVNVVENLTIDVGRNNPGAIALDYLANNIGAVRHVALIGHADSGAIGLSLTRKWIGPALISDLSIDGFPIGIDIANSEYGVTMERVRISGSTIVGLRNAGNVASIDDLETTTTRGPAIRNDLPGGLMVITGATFAGAADAAIVNRGHLNLTGVTASGFVQGIAGTVPRPTLDGVYNPSGRIGETAWRLKPAAAPVPLDEDPSAWCDVRAHGADPTGASDSVGAIRACLTSGARTVFFPFGVYAIGDVLDVPQTVERIFGPFATLTARDDRKPGFTRAGGMIRVGTGGAPLVIDKLAFDMTDRGSQLAVEHSGARALLLQDIVSAGTRLVRRLPGGGPLFADDVCCGPVDIAGPAGAWLRQFNSEGSNTRLFGRGAPIRVLGIKVEHMLTIADNSEGGTIEIAGGLVYPVVPGDLATPLAINRGGRLVLGYVEESFRDDAVYAIHLLSQTGSGDRTVGAEALPLRNAHGARVVPQLIDDTR